MQSVPHADGTKIHFGDTGQFCFLKAETIASFADTGNLGFVRRQFEWPVIQSGISKIHHHVELTSLGGAWRGYTNKSFSEMTAPHRVSIQPRKLDVPQILHGIPHPFCVDVFHGEQKITNLKERFYFPGLPIEVAAIKNEASRMEWLANCVGDFLQRENKQFNAMAQARQKEQEQKFPKCNPAKSYLQQNFDHHANQREVLLKLLRRKWHRLSRATDKIKNAKTDTEKSDAQTMAWLGFIADHKAIFGKVPDINEKEFAELRNNDKWLVHFSKLMSEAIYETPQGDKRDWQLASGWIEKNYYRMNAGELEAAFTRDWKYKPGLFKGNSLAKRAQRLGLVSYLTRGPKK